MNIRNSVPNDHIQSISEIAKSQSSMIQLLTIEIQEKDKEIERLNNKIKEQSLLLIEFQDMEQRLKEKDDIIDGLENWLKLEIQYNADINEEYNEGIENTLNRLKELKEGK